MSQLIINQNLDEMLKLINESNSSIDKMKTDITGIYSSLDGINIEI